MEHDVTCEERLFSADIQALRENDSGFDSAWRNGTPYEMEIKLPEIYQLCPRKYARSLMYSRLVRFLATRNITLNIVSRKNKLKKKTTMKLVIIDDFVFDANAHTKEQIEGLVQATFDSKTKPGTLKFTYGKTANGYMYKIDRHLPYGYNGNVIIDIDCSFLTGEPIERFQTDTLNPAHKPLVIGFLGSNTNGYYIPIQLFEDFYKQLLGMSDNAEKPKNVNVYASSTCVKVQVEY